MKFLANLVACSSLYAASGVASVQSITSSPPLDPLLPRATGETGSTGLDASLGRPISALPYTISLPGRYYLTTNLTGVAGQNGITIAASGVTLDLMGFELVGVAGSLNGVNAVFTTSNMAIHNGTVRDWGLHGIYAGSAPNGLYRDLRVSANGYSGLASGQNSSVFNCTASENNFSGIGAGGGSTVSNCTAKGNREGIRSGQGIVTIVNCTASYNTGAGIEVATGTISGCTVSGNGSDGIVAINGSTVSACTAMQNSGSGITVLGVDPFFDRGRGTISGCTASLNHLSGIEVDHSSLVVENTCTNNNGPGILVVGPENRIDSNNVTGNGRGIWIQDPGNLIIRNSASGNSLNYEIGVGNRYGSIVDITAGGTSGVSGNQAMSTVATTDPWANFAF